MGRIFYFYIASVTDMPVIMRKIIIGAPASIFTKIIVDVYEDEDEF